MVVLVGKNLGERQRDLNSKVAEIIANKTNFDEIKNEPEETDVDKLIKIDVASKYKNIDYIIEILKSCDNLYISRALKSLWLYDEEYNHVMNPDNLHANIFPYMSLKMKAKTLFSISKHIGNPDRASTFFSYCIKNNMTNNALKFLNLTSEEFKLNVLKIKTKELNIMRDYLDEPKFLKYYVGDSFVLAAACLEIEGRRILDDLGYMYSISSKQYLELFEKHNKFSLDQLNYYTPIKPFGLRISKDIMTKHKNKVLEKPLCYVFKIKKNMLMKYSTSNDVKKYATFLMPANVTEFWNLYKNDKFSFIYNAIPVNERFQFVKHLFTTNYPGESFEMSSMFYQSRCYTLMTAEEKNLWALRHLESDDELLGLGKNYLWYEFINFEKAFPEIKKLILITPNSNKRSEMLLLLVKTTKDQKDIIKLLNYYYERHVNETYFEKREFIQQIIEFHNVFEFDNDCWTALKQLLCSIDVYTMNSFSDKPCVAVAIIYHILHKLDMPQKFKDFIELDINYSSFRNFLDKLGEERSEIVFQYILNLLIIKLKPFEEDPHNKILGRTLKQYVNNIWTLLSCFKKDDNKDCPEIVKKFMSIHSSTEKEVTVTSNDILRLLKKDATLALDALSRFESFVHNPTCAMNTILKKLKIYFSNDLAKQFLSTLYSWLTKTSERDFSDYFVVLGVVFALFQLGDESFKKDLLEKYVPIVKKIDHLGKNQQKENKKNHDIQIGICRFMGYSRPPVPLENVLQYMKGDYVQYCLPIINMYRANLPHPLFIKFTEALLNAPVSVQKHGLRLAFQCYSTESLKNLLIKVWKKSKNVSLRLVLYKSLYNKMLEEDEVTKMELFEILKLFTSDLHQDDDHEIFSLIVDSQMPERFKGDYLQSAWNMARKLPEKPINLKRRYEIITCMGMNIHLVQRDFLRKFLLDEHVPDIFENKRLRRNESSVIEKLNDAKWSITEKYIVHCTNENELKESLEIVQYVMNKSLEKWDDIHENIYISRRFCKEFINNMLRTLKYAYIVPILQNILDLLQGALPIREIYFYVWDLRLAIIGKNILCMKLSTNEVCVKFANEIGNLVKEFKDKEQYYASFTPYIAKSMHYTLNKITCLTKRTLLEFCESLVNLGMVESYLIALNIIPIDIDVEPYPDPEYELNKDTHKKLLIKISELDNDEVQIKFSALFLLNDFKNRF